MKPLFRMGALLLVLVVLSGMAVSCSNADIVSDDTTIRDNAGPSSPSKDVATKPQKKKPQDKKDLQIASPQEKQDKTDKKEAGKAPNYNVNEPFDIQQPTLMGFTIGNSLDGVTARFGKPTAESTMNDGTQTLRVLEYPGFSFGAADDKTIVFIEVVSDVISPGLNQFRVGQTVDEAQKALGPADSINDYVMIYEESGLVLKCDLDPTTKQVLAVKLFAS